MNIGRLHIITDYWFQQTLSHAELASLAIAGGADTIQFRQKHGSTRHLLHEARETGDVCRAGGVTYIVNDRVDLALAVEADGVHLGHEDHPIASARKLLGDQAIIGATATSLEDALRAREEGASYIGFGPVFFTASKTNPASVKGLDGLSQVCKALEIPVVAIAGITAERVPQVIAAGAFGVAVMTAVSLSEHPEAAVRGLAEALAKSTP